MDKSKHIILTFGLWNYFCAFILRLKSKGCNCPCIIALLYYSAAKKLKLNCLSHQQYSHLFGSASSSRLPLCFWFEEGMMGYILAWTLAAHLMPVGENADSIHRMLLEWKDLTCHLGGGGAFRLTCWLCVSVWEDTLCVCVPGCHSWSSLSLLQPGHTGGPAGHSGHKTGSVSKLRCKQW